MLNYMNAEFYKVFHRKYPYATLLTFCALAALLCSGFIFTNGGGAHVEFSHGAENVLMVLSVGLYAALLICDMVFSEQYKSNTLKNEVSFGVPRARIYLGKLAVEAVIGVVMSVLVIAFYLGMCYVTLYASTPEETLRTMQIVGYCVLAAIPQWLAALALTNMFFFLVKGSTLASFLAVGVIAVTPVALELTALMVWEAAPQVSDALLMIRSWMPTQIIEKAMEVVGDWGFMGKSFLVGGVWIAATSAIGLAGFHKKEIA